MTQTQSDDPRFFFMDLDEPEHSEGVREWIADDVLVGIVDQHAGIIGYTHRTRAEQFVLALEALAASRGVTGEGTVGPPL